MYRPIRKKVSVHIAHAVGLVLGVLAVATPAAHAGPKVLVSAPVGNEAGGIACVITNAGPKAVTVSAMETYGLHGTNPLLSEPLTIPPGAFVGKGSGETFGYCRFKVNQNPKTLRAAACRFQLQPGDKTGTTFECLEAR